MKKDNLLYVGTLASAILPAIPVTAKSQKRNMAVTNRQEPNVIIIFTEDLGCGDIECFGATRVQTPNVNALARVAFSLPMFTLLPLPVRHRATDC